MAETYVTSVKVEIPGFIKGLEHTNTANVVSWSDGVIPKVSSLMTECLNPFIYLVLR